MASAEEIYAALEARRVDLGLSQAEVGVRAFGKPDNAAFQALRRGSSPSASKLAALCKAVGWDFYFGPPRDSGAVESVKVGGADYASISLHDAWLSAGPGAENHVSNIVDQLAFRRDWLTREGIDAARACLARVMGDSMAPTLSCGDMVLINQTQAEPAVRRRGVKDKRRSPIYALVEGGEARIKRIERPDEETMILISDNPDYPPEIRTSAQREKLQTTITGKVMWWGHTNRE